MRSWRNLAALTEAELSAIDIAEAHCVCAVGLPGAEHLDFAFLQRTLEQWTWQAEKGTNRLLRIFDREPARFQNSRAYCSMMALVTVLQRDLGVTATTKLNDLNAPFSDSRDLFLHGILMGCPGTCSSLAPLYAAIGRRLGYPLRLVPSPHHQFLRWDNGPAERFNIECTSSGFFTPPDDYYGAWPFPITPEQRENSFNFKSLTSREELATFLVQRAYCLAASLRFQEAVECAAWSYELVPYHHAHARTLGRLMGLWDSHLGRVLPHPFPPVNIEYPPRLFQELGIATEREIVRMRVLDDLSRRPEIQAAHQPLLGRFPTAGVPSGLPRVINVRCPPWFWKPANEPDQQQVRTE